MVETPLWTRAELQAATAGRFEGLAAGDGFDGVSIDSRAVAAGDIFVAIKGDRLDGHDFVTAALRGGAGLGLVSRADAQMRESGALYVVADPLKALEDMGRAARARSRAKIIAVTGSVGKTSTKEGLRVALGASGLTHASVASFNNHWGVPLTLARMRRETAYGVFEIGMNHAGEITPLVKMVRPHIALITTIAPVHLGQFASLDEIADAKAEIFLGVERGGIAIINRDTLYFDRLSAAARACGIDTIISFGRHGKADIRLERMVLHETCSCVTANIMGDAVIYKIGMPGEHMVLNSLGVLAGAKAAGADMARAALALAALEPPKGRGVRLPLHVPGGTALLIDESYNANPVSVKAALKLLGQTPPTKGGRRIAVLGDMLELGPQAAQFHAELLDAMDEGQVDVLYACGPLMEHLWAKTPTARRGVHAATSEDLTQPVVSAIRPGDVVMVKGSLGSRMGPIVAALKAAYSAAGKES